MIHSEYIEKKRDELITVANRVIVGEVPLLEGVRKIHNLSSLIEERDNPVFLRIRGIESQTDHYPVGEVRNQYNPDSLRKLDHDLEQYMASVREDIFDSCRKIIEIFEKQ